MKIQFYLRFHTQVGQSIFVTGNIGALNHAGPQGGPLPLHFVSEEFWGGTLELSESRTDLIRYSYVLQNADGMLISEWGDDRLIDPNLPGVEEIQVLDTWNHAGEYENCFYTSPFQQTLLRPHKFAETRKRVKSYTHEFKVKAPLLKKDEELCLIGSNQALGEWDTLSPQPMFLEGNWWVCKVKLPKESLPVAYKYGVWDAKESHFLHYEQGANRILHGDAHKKKITILHDGFVHLPNNTWRGAGVAIPVFSLRSKDSFGVGEFEDLKLLAEWAKKTGLKLIQILPVNDTSASLSWLDSYPYAAISAFALHPIYVNLAKVAGKKYASVVKVLRDKQERLDKAADLDYEEVMKTKIAVMKELFGLMKEEFLQDKEFNAFFEQNRHWLIPYAAFCYLRDRNETPDFSKWKIYSQYDQSGIEKFVSPKAKHYNAIALQYFIQFHLHMQLREATHYAHKLGVIVKGDIPIGIYRYSCDAWVEPRLYHLDVQAGAPPDDFAIKGQNWGFPTYNWEQMAKDGFCWWKKRFEQMSHYFDAFRIDHILGFFRIWSIPLTSVEGLMGHFDPALPVTLSELGSNTAAFDRHRFTAPFITEAVLWELFGSDSDMVKASFLVDHGTAIFELKPEFTTQRAVEAHFAGLEQDEHHHKIKEGLFDLLSNVILFEAEGSNHQQFHFRIAVESTQSFRYLDWHTQQRLKDIYINYFYRRQDHFWREEALKKLPALKRATNMLVCGEDLGMVPDCVPDVMKQLGILSLEIQRMPKDPTREFFHPADAPYLSVVTPSTHDMSTIRGWWEEDRGRTQRFFNHELGQWGDAPFFCEPWINKAIVIQHLYSPAMWSIFQLQDLLGMSESLRRENPHDERINVPANPKNYWKYRMHLSLEDLIKSKGFNEELKTYIHASGR